MAFCTRSFEERRRICTEYRDDGYNSCVEYRDNGYNSCVEYRENGYHSCVEYRDNGYNACTEYRDNGYHSCAEWRKNCCDWWPCNWVCEVFSWFCFAWVWISNWVCVAWIWVSSWVCIAWVWVSSWVCIAWVWVSSWVCIAWIWISSLVCIAWEFITVAVNNTFCAFICSFRRLFAHNEVRQRISECIYSWPAAYRIEEDNLKCLLNVTVRIRLQPDDDITDAELQNAMALWEPAIENAWTNQFDLIQEKSGDCNCDEYNVNVNVQFVEDDEHTIVEVERGPGRANRGRWFHDSTGGTAAHEVGHMLGYVDEYADPNCPNRTVTNDGSLMQNSQTGTVRLRHYQRFADWISSRTCCNYEVGT